MKQFLINYTSQFNIGAGQGGTQVAIVGAFADGPRMLIPFTGNLTIEQLQTAIAAIPEDLGTGVSPDINGFFQITVDNDVVAGPSISS